MRGPGGCAIEVPSLPSKGPPNGREVRTTLRYPGGGGSFDAERAGRPEWGAEAGRGHAGRLEGTPDGGRPAEGEMDEGSTAENPLAQDISATLESIRRHLEENPAVVRDAPPPGYL